MFRSADCKRGFATPGFLLGCLVLLAATPLLREVPPSAALWAGPAILAAAMMIAWAAESAQFFVSQGLALAILAWLQTLPEFAVEFVYAWRQQVPLLLANLTGSLRLLTGLAWPMIYLVAAIGHRRRYGRPLKAISLDEGHSVEVVGLLVPVLYMLFVWAKGSLTVVDAVVLAAIYAGYLMVLRRMPPEAAEGIEELERVPRAIVKARRPIRNASIVGLFTAGGLIIYYCAEPFAGSLVSVAAALGIPTFVFVQWVAPFVSEFPEKVSAFYWARTVDRASMALMNMVSSNINQWTLLAAMLPVVYSISCGRSAAIVFDHQQSLELLMTLGQALVGMLFLVNMQLAWWEASALFGLWFLQFVFSPIPPEAGWLGGLARAVHLGVTVAYYVWFVLGLGSYLVGRRELEAFRVFGRLWNQHVWPSPAGASKR